MTGRSSIHAFDAETGVIDADAGLSLDALMRHVVPLGWFPRVTPGTRHVTLGGALAANVHGKNHHVDGAWAAGVRSFVLVTPPPTPDRPALSTEVTQESDPEAFWATVGGMGLTGVVARMALQLDPIPSAWLDVETQRSTNLEDAIERMRLLDRDHRYTVAWIDCMAKGPRLGRAVLSGANWAEPDQLPPRLREDAHAFDPSVLGKVPGVLTTRILARPVVRAFNTAWYAKAARQEGRQLQSIASFFHPLDAVEGWNRLYGRRGFLQYQFVVPLGAEDTLEAIVAETARRGTASFLAVLKRFGEGDAGHLSFPMPGWTFTLDIPLGSSDLRPMLARFDRMVADAGGRVYLAKDAALSPDLVSTMYPRLSEWRKIRDRLDPGQHMRSDLDRRLDLVGRSIR
jgi:decaprenylphospho-beta-D-ribofuranose 2-oxidase